MSMTSDVSQDDVHAQEPGTGTNLGIIFIGHGVEKGHTLALFQHLIISRGEQAVGEAVPLNSINYTKMHFKA